MGWPNFTTPTNNEVNERTIQIGSLTNRDIRCVGISVNTSSLNPEERENYLNKLSKEVGLPCVDPLKNGTQKIIDYLNIVFNNK